MLQHCSFCVSLSVSSASLQGGNRGLGLASDALLGIYGICCQCGGYLVNGPMQRSNRYGMGYMTCRKCVCQDVCASQAVSCNNVLQQQGLCGTLKCLLPSSQWRNLHLCRAQLVELTFPARSLITICVRASQFYHGQSCQQSSMVTLVWLRIVLCIGLTHHIPKQSGHVLVAQWLSWLQVLQ